MVKLFFKVGYWILVLSSSILNIHAGIFENSSSEDSDRENLITDVGVINSGHSRTDDEIIGASPESVSSTELSITRIEPPPQNAIDPIFLGEKKGDHSISDEELSTKMNMGVHLTSEEIGKLMQDNKNLKERNKRNKGTIRRLKEENSTLSQANLSLQSVLARQNDRETKFREEINQLKEQLDYAAVQKDVEVIKLRESISEYEKKIHQNNDALDIAKETEFHLQEQVKEKSSILFDIVKDIQTHRKEDDKRQKQIVELNSELNKKDKMIDKLEGIIANHEEQEAHLQEEIEEKNRLLADTSKAMYVSNTQIGNLNRPIAKVVYEACLTKRDNPVLVQTHMRQK